MFKNSIITVMKSYNYIKLILKNNENFFTFKDNFSIFELFTKNLLEDLGNLEAKALKSTTITDLLTLYDYRILSKAPCYKLSRLTFYQILKQIPPDLLKQARYLEIISKPDEISRTLYSDQFSKGLDVTIIRLYR